MGKDVIIWLVLAIVAFIVIGQFAGPILKRSQLTRSTTSQGNVSLVGEESLREPARESGVVVAEIVKEPLVYDGLTVTLEGRSVDWLTKKSFTLNEPDVKKTAKILVIAPRDLPNPEDVDDKELALGDNTLVRVTGQVRILSEEDIERRLGVDFDSRHLRGYNFNDKPVLVATSVEELN